MAGTLLEGLQAWRGSKGEQRKVVTDWKDKSWPCPYRRALSLPVLLPTLLQAARTAEINRSHPDEVCQHRDTPGLLQENREKQQEANACWSFQHHRRGILPGHDLSLLKGARRKHCACKPAPVGHKELPSIP